MKLLADPAVRAAIVVLAGLGLHMLLRWRSASLRHAVLAASLLGAAATLPLGALLPSWDLPHAALVARGPHSVAVSPASFDTPAVPAPASPLSLLFILWGVGCVAGAAVLASGLGRLAWLSSRAERVVERRWVQLADQVRTSYGIRRRVTLLRTGSPDLLATWGVFRPRVLLPADAREWSDERAHVVLCHELAHVRRCDWCVQLGADVLRTIYWFNPLLWIACTRLRRDSEQACDDVVLSAGVPAQAYAAHLLELVRRSRRRRPSWAPATPMARPSTLERRIAAMLNPSLDRTAVSGRAFACTAALLLAVTLPTAAFRTAQAGPLPLSGSIYDASGAVVPGVIVTLDDGRSPARKATTSPSGRFVFDAVQPGRYLLGASLPGFRPLAQDLELRRPGDWERAVTLQVGEVSETIVIRERRPDASLPAGAAGPAPLRVGGNIRAPRKIADVKPIYPPAMRDAGREGMVPIEAVIGRDGDVTAVRVLSAQVHPDFALAAVDAVRQWRFDPTLLNGVPVEIKMTVSVEFSLSE